MSQPRAALRPLGTAARPNVVGPSKRASAPSARRPFEAGAQAALAPAAPSRQASRRPAVAIPSAAGAILVRQPAGRCELASPIPPATVMGQVATDGLALTPPSALSGLVEVAMGPGAPEVRLRTSTTLQLAIAPRPTAPATAAVRSLLAPLLGAVPTTTRLAPTPVVLAIRMTARPIPSAGQLP